MDGWKINLPFKLVPFQGCNAFPQACHRHLWVTPGMVSWHLGKVSFCIPCILQAASWSAEFTKKKHERNHHDLELEELDILFFLKIWCFFATTAHQCLDSTQQSLFQEPPYSAAPFFQRVSCRNSDAGCTYQWKAPRCSSLREETPWEIWQFTFWSFRKFQWKNCMNCQVVPGERRCGICSPCIPRFCLPVVEVGRGIWLAVLTWDCLSPSWVIVSPAKFRVPEMLSSRASAKELAFRSSAPTTSKSFLSTQVLTLPSQAERHGFWASSPDEKCRHDDSQRKKTAFEVLVMPTLVLICAGVSMACQSKSHLWMYWFTVCCEVFRLNSQPCPTAAALWLALGGSHLNGMQIATGVNQERGHAMQLAAHVIYFSFCGPFFET